MSTFDSHTPKLYKLTRMCLVKFHSTFKVLLVENKKAKKEKRKK